MYDLARRRRTTRRSFNWPRVWGLLILFLSSAFMGWVCTRLGAWLFG